MLSTVAGASNLKLYVLVTDGIHIFFQLYIFLILARVIASWIRIDPNNGIMQFVYNLTDPFLGFIERFMPNALLAPLNWSPVIAIFILSFLQSILVRLALYLIL